MRLDRAVGSPEWMELYSQALVQHITSSRSDHFPILIKMQDMQQTKQKSLHRYEAMWERENSLGEQIEEAWTNYATASSLDDIQKKLCHTVDCLSS